VHLRYKPKIRWELLACIAVRGSAESESVAVRIGLEASVELLAAATDIYYLTDQYVNYPVVLVRLSIIRPNVSRDLLGIAR
jgi:hypothetical protein